MPKESLDIYCQAHSKPLREFLPLVHCRRELESFTSYHLPDVICEEDVNAHKEQTQAEITQMDHVFEGIPITCW